MVDLYEVGLKAFGAFLVVAIGWLLGVVLPRTLSVDMECLRRGYPEARVTLAGNAYCIGRGNNGESVVVKLPI